MGMNKLAEMKSLGDPIQCRFREHEARTNLVQTLRKATLKSLKKTPKPSVDPAQLQELDKKRSEATAWLAAKEAEQGRLAKHEDPVLLCADLESRIEAISRLAASCEPDENATGGVVESVGVETM